MAVFENLVGSGIITVLCLFMLRSHFTFPMPSKLRCAVILSGCCAVIAAAGFFWDWFAVSVIAAFLAGLLLCRFLAQAPTATALLFGFVFCALRLAAFGITRFALNLFSLSVSNALLPEITVLYALAVCACALSEKWRTASIPVVQLLLTWIMSVILCEESIRCARTDGIILQILAYVWTVYATLLLMQLEIRMEQQYQALREKQQKARHYALQEEYYHQLQDKQKETRALWHDLNKYLRAAKAEAQPVQALQQLEAMLSSATEVVDVGNQVLNVILNEYTQMAKAAGAQLQLAVQVPETLPVSAADLYVIIGNTMDNAIEACNALPTDQRVIHLLLRTHNNVLFYRLANPDTPERPPQPNADLHGHGLPNVRRCVEKYGGFTDVIRENGFFTITAHLNLHWPQA